MGDSRVTESKTYGCLRNACCAALLWFLTAASAALPVSNSLAASSTQPVMLFSAASTTNAVTELVELYRERKGVQVRTVFAASSTLAKQIANGAPADLFLSANERWMAYLADRGAVEADSAVTLFGNRLVLIVNSRNHESSAGLPATVETSLPLTDILGKDRLAIGNPTHVPAGIYAKAALESLGLWENLDDKLAFSNNVRTALTLVERGEAAAGIVYETDALLVPQLKVAGIFPADSHPPISYPLAIVTERRSGDVEAFYRFLRSPAASEVFARHGFAPKPAPK